MIGEPVIAHTRCSGFDSPNQIPLR